MKSIFIFLLNLFIVFCLFSIATDHLWSLDTFSIIRNILCAGLGLYLSYNAIRIYALKKESPEQGLIYRVVGKLQIYFAKFYTYIKPVQREFLIWLGIAVGIGFISLVLVGIPGAFLISIPAWLGLTKELEGDGVWPAAILVSLLWPISLPVGVLIKYRLKQQGNEKYSLFGFIGTVLLAIILSTLIGIALAAQ